MFTKYAWIVEEDESRIPVVKELCIKYGLHCAYKIGVYDDCRQHELFVTGSRRKINKMIKELETV